MRVFGIDVSQWQSNFDFAAAKAEGVRFAIIRGAYHLTKDAEFERYYSKAKKAGLDVGVYQYTMATDTAAALREAEYAAALHVLRSNEFFCFKKCKFLKRMAFIL